MHAYDTCMGPLDMTLLPEWTLAVYGQAISSISRSPLQGMQEHTLHRRSFQSRNIYFFAKVFHSAVEMYSQKRLGTAKSESLYGGELS